MRNQLANLLSEKLGFSREAELLLRETIARYERDPDEQVQFNVLIARNQLSTVLENEGRLNDAKNYLTETAEIFPNSIRVRNQLALLLSSKLYRSGDAEEILRKAITLPIEGPFNSASDLVVSRNQLAEVLIRRRHPEAEQDAKQILAETIARYTNNMGAESLLNDLQARASSHDEDPLNGLPDDSLGDYDKQPKTPVEAPLLDGPENALDIESICDTAQASRLMTLVRAINASTNSEEIASLHGEAQTLLNKDPNSPYIRLLATEAGIEEAHEEETVFAVALWTATIRRSLEELRSLKSRFTNTQQQKLVDRAYNIRVIARLGIC